MKKMGAWSFSRDLVKRIVKIAFCSLLMGLVLYVERFLLEMWNPNWLDLSVMVKLLLLTVVGGIAVLSFLVMIKMCGIMDVFTFAKNMMSRRRRR